jgi:hypothetical protein
VAASTATDVEPSAATDAVTKGPEADADSKAAETETNKDE